MADELKKLLEEEARKIQESTIPKEEVENSEKIIDISYEEVGKFKVYTYEGKVIEVEEDELRFYRKCEDGTWVYFTRVLELPDGKNYNPLTEKVSFDQFDNFYIIERPETWKNLIFLKDRGNSIAKEEKISIISLDTEEVLWISSIDKYIELNELTNHNLEIVNGAIQKRRSPELFKQQLFEKYPYFEQVVRSIYGDNWDISYHSHFASYCLIIKFDCFNITNSRRQIHEIKDLYVLVPFVVNDKEKTIKISGSLYGGRGILSTSEREVHYRHSHLTGSWNSISSFCLGRGPISSYIASFNIDPNENNLFSVIYNIKIYVEWESIEGTPYKYIGNLGKMEIPDTEYINFDFDRLFKSYLSDFKLPIKIYNTGTSNNIQIDEKIIETQLLKYIGNTSEKGIHFNENYRVYKDRTTEKYYKKSVIQDSSEVSKEVLLQFKEEKIYTRIEQEKKINIQDIDYVAHPSITRQFIENALRRVRKYYFEKTTDVNKRESKNYYI